MASGACSSCRVKLSDCFVLDRASALEFLASHGIINFTTKCTRCRMSCEINKVTLAFRCRRHFAVGKRRKLPCTFKKSARVGTFLEQTKLQPDVLVKLVAILLHLRPPRQDLIQRELEVSTHTVVNWYSYCREVFFDHIVRVSEKLGGPDTIVEIDEAKFGKRKYNRGRRIEGQWVFGGKQRGTGNCFLVPVESRDAETLLNIIKEWILPGTTIMSDCWKAYNCLSNESYTHLRVNHSVNFVDPITGAHTNTIERTWREVRHTIPRYGHRKKHFVGYLAEYLFKARYPDHLTRMHHFFRAAAELYPPQY